nr:hypothetical protein [Tanacetum cinerariifolium]
TTSDGTGKKKGRTVTLTTEDMQKRKNDYGNFKVEGSETLEQTFNRLQRNKGDLDTMSLDDLYNHLKVYESEVQKKSKPNSQNMAFISSAKHSRGNEEVNTASVSTASTNVSTASANIRIAEDDIEEMDIKWNMALLSMRADRFWKKTGKKISIQGTDVAGFDKSKVKCFNCHKMGHFAREWRAPKSQDRGRRDNYRQGSKVDEQAPKALMAIDGVGWDWIYMANDEENHALIADEETPTKFTLMTKTNAESEVFDNSLCSKACKKNSDSLNGKITELTDKLYDAKNMIYHYKLALAQELELIKKEKEGLDSKLAGFQTPLKDIDSLLESQRLDKNKEGLGYSDVPPPPAQVYSPPKKDLSWTGLPKFKDDTVTDYSRPSPAIESTSDDAQNRNPFEALPSFISPKSFIKFVKANDSPTKSKTYKVETAKKPPVKYAEQYRKPIKKTNVKGNQRNWNNLKSHQLGPNFVMEKKACFNYGDFNHLAYDFSKRVKKGTSRSQNTTHKSFTPRTVIHKPYRPLMRPMRTNMNVAQPNRTSFYKPAHLYTKRPFQRTSAVRSQYKCPRVPPISRSFSTVNRKFPTANRKFPTGGTKFSTADMGKKGKDVKVPRSLMIARGEPNLAKRDFRNLQTTRASLVGSAFASTHFDK